MTKKELIWGNHKNLKIKVPGEKWPQQKNANYQKN